jgi:hypothetical protein
VAGRRFRAVTHLDVAGKDIDEALARLAEVAPDRHAERA